MSEEDPQVMSKSKKKRLRKKKSKSKNGNESVASSNESIISEKQQLQQGLTAATGKLLTPQEALRQSLLSKGFTANEIDLAMEEMWDKGLPYDEYDSVMKYLERSDDDDDDDGEATTTTTTTVTINKNMKQSNN